MKTTPSLETHSKTLPKWAQIEIGILLNRIVKLESEIKQRQSNTPTKTYISDPIGESWKGDKEYLAAYSVTFETASGVIEVSHDRDNPNAIRLMSHGIKGCLRIRPHAANVIMVETCD